jgi:hypothetical protein
MMLGGGAWTWDVDGPPRIFFLKKNKKNVMPLLFKFILKSQLVVNFASRFS